MHKRLFLFYTGLCPGAVDAVNVSFEDGATGAGVFHGVGTGAGAGFDAIVGVFVDEPCVALIKRPTPLERRPHRRLRGDLVLASAPTCWDKGGETH